MIKQDFTMQSILDIPVWEKIQDHLAKLTGTAIICIDYKGTPVTKHSARTDFCSVIRENPVSRKRCFRCDALAGLEAVRLVNEISSFQAEEENARVDLLKMYERLAEMEYDRIVETAELISSLAEYMVHKAVDSSYKQQTYEWMYRLAGDKEVDSQELKSVIEPLEPISVPDTLETCPVYVSSPVYPAIEYIRNHPREKVSMREMALLCRISESHFSRTFTRDAGENLQVM